MAGNPITVEELQILISADYGEAIQGMLKMVEQAKQIAKNQLAPVQEYIQKTAHTNIRPAQQTVKQTESMTRSAVQSVRKAASEAKKSLEQLIDEHDYLNEKIRISQKQYDLMKNRLSGMRSGGNTESSLRLEKQLLDAQKRLKAMARESDRMAESIRRVESGAVDTNRAIEKGTKEIQQANDQMRKFGDNTKASANKANKGFAGFAKTLKSTAKYMVVFILISTTINAVTESISNMALESEEANKNHVILSFQFQISGKQYRICCNADSGIY